MKYHSFRLLFLSLLMVVTTGLASCDKQQEPAAEMRILVNSSYRCVKCR